MDSICTSLKTMVAEIGRSLGDLLKTHSKIYLWNEPGSGIFWASGNYGWTPLNQDGRRLQGKLLDDYRRFCDILAILISKHTQDTLASFEKAKKTVLKLIEQNGCTWSSTVEEELQQGLSALKNQAELLDRLYSISEDKVLFVPDTNAVLYHPAIEVWRFTEAARFMIVLTPTVVSELDLQKVNHRVEEVRRKAESVIRRIKEYRRRGRLTEGVTLVDGVSEILVIATEPEMERSLPWLDFENSDDRLLASTIEVMRMHPRSGVVLVTRDLNLQNKAEFARVPFVEPPEP